MTVVASRLEALVVARARTVGKQLSLAELISPLARFAPVDIAPPAWRDRVAEVVSALRASDVLDDGYRLRDEAELVRRIGRSTARSWRQLADGVLPGLGLGIAADDSKARGKLAGRDAWAAAIVARSLGLWSDGAPPSLSAVCDALAWRELGLAGKPQRCPSAIRALFVQRVLGTEPAAPDRLVRVLAAREVGAPRPELKALCDALVRGWLAGRGVPAVDAAAEREMPGPSDARSTETGAANADAPAEHADASSANPEASPGHAEPTFAEAALRAAAAVEDGRFGDRKVFASAAWEVLRRAPAWSGLALDDFKARLLAAHRAGELTLARADLVAAMDPVLVAASEIVADGASFHFVVVEPAG